MYLPALFEMAIEEEAAESRAATEQRNGAAGNHAPADVIVTIGNSEGSRLSGDEDEERAPLQGAGGGASNMVDTEDDSGTTGDKLSAGGDEDLDNPGKQKKMDKKCCVVGVLLLLVILTGAMAGILMNKFASAPAYQFQFANFYSSHMVLQRSPLAAVVWGYGPVTADNRSITLTLDGGGGEGGRQEHHAPITQTVAGPVWKVILDPVSERGPFTLTASLEGQPELIQITDVLFGDVWVCGGQSNMQYSMGLLAQELEDEDIFADLSEHQDVRIMSVAAEKSNVPWFDVQKIQLRWALPSQETLAPDESPSQRSHQFSSHFSALCWLYGKQLHSKLKYPIGLVSSTYSNSALEDWVSHDVINTCDINVPHATSLVYNAMMHPLLSFTFYGAIFYQGESDALQQPGRLAGRYNCTFVNMIGDLRRKLYEGTLGAADADFPFGFVQLAPNREGENYTFGFTDIRWQQTGNYGYAPNSAMPKTFMAVAVDLPDVNSTFKPLHSRYKRLVAERLVLGALGVGYGRRGLGFAGPRPTEYAVSAAARSLDLRLALASNLETRAHTGFEVCCSDNASLPCPSSFISVPYAPGRKWFPAPVVTATADTVTLSYRDACTGSRPHAVALRYLWRETPCPLLGCALYDADTRLPAPPFIAQRLHGDGRWHPLTGPTDLL